MLSKSKLQDRIRPAKLRHTLHQIGLLVVSKITDTLQGDIWNALHLETNQQVVVKVANKALHSQAITLQNGQTIPIYENILTESRILEFLSADPNCSVSIIKHCGLLNSDEFYYLLMENAGSCLFDFTVKAHRFIQNGDLTKREWFRMVRFLFKQMLDAVEYLHSKNVCHFDISLENFCINEVEVELRDGKFTFCIGEADDVRVKLIDFGLAQLFSTNSNFMTRRPCGKSRYYSPEICRKMKYNAKKNDIWCLGISLFMMVFGGAPWERATSQYLNFTRVMRNKGDISSLATSRGDDDACDAILVDLFKHFFQFEAKRADLQTIKQHPWLQQ